MNSQPDDTHLTHVDGQGQARMVDVGSKPITRRLATARSTCRMQPETARQVRANANKKGDVLQVARIAAIMAAKRTDSLIPLCHSLPLDSVSVEFEWQSEAQLRISATVACTGRTGVEMEALVAVSVAGLTVYDMCKSIDRELCIENVELVSKSGGVHGDFQR
ncbi:MAG: cyclic pyranopterin monophosphate synthase MoaC [Pirellulaceae bacterium]